MKKEAFNHTASSKCGVYNRGRYPKDLIRRTNMSLLLQNYGKNNKKRNYLLSIRKNYIILHLKFPF